MSGTLTSMIRTIALAVALCLAMILPHLPGRYDSSAEALSFAVAVRVASYASLLMVPVGLCGDRRNEPRGETNHNGDDQGENP